MSIQIETKRALVAKFLELQGDKFYTVTFVKKTTGELRVMNCRQGVKKYSKGGKNNADGKADIWSTYSLDAKGYRCIFLDTVTEIRGKDGVITFDQVTEQSEG